MGNQESKAIARPKQIVIGQAVAEAKVVASRRMRKQMTFAESLPWSRLRSRQVAGAKFRRQQIVAGFIADFYCHEHGIAVEADGASHEQQHDEERDAVFAAKGIVTIRFSNADIVSDIENVVERLRNEIEQRATPLSVPGGQRS